MSDQSEKLASALAHWRHCAAPDIEPIEGRFVRIEAARFPDHGPELFAAIGGPDNDELWRYIPIGPFGDADTLGATMKFVIDNQGWQTHLIRATQTNHVLGMASYMRIRPEHGSAEVGCIVYSKQMQRTAAATEAMYLMARHLFETRGYRRYEWKCNAANDASKRAALRLGFTFEGVFRQDMVVKGENRDTAWYTMLDHEWPQAKAAFEAWLAPENFAGGVQRKSLAQLRDRV